MQRMLANSLTLLPRLDLAGGLEQSGSTHLAPG